jgi:methylthioribose-1-phosphate isomerase
VRVAPEGVRVYNPAFDVTPAEHISAIVTERGVLRPPFDAAIAGLRR